MKKAYALAFGDEHTGALRSLLAPKSVRHIGEGDDEVQEVHLTVLQEYLWNSFQDMIQKIHHYTERFVLLDPGDMLQGNRNVWATKLCLPLFDDQVEANLRIKGELVKAGAFDARLCHGTDFHKQEYCDHEMEIARRLRANHDKDDTLKGVSSIPARYNDRFNVRILDKVINMVHSHSTVQDYPSVPMDKEIEGSWLKEALKQAPHADVLIRAHIHPTTFAASTRDEKQGFFNLCWQLPDSVQSTRKARFYRSYPMLGSVLLEITEEPMPHGVRLIPFKYPPPSMEMRVETIKW